MIQAVNTKEVKLSSTPLDTPTVPSSSTGVSSSDVSAADTLVSFCEVVELMLNPFTSRPWCLPITEVPNWQIYLCHGKSSRPELRRLNLLTTPDVPLGWRHRLYCRGQILLWPSRPEILPRRRRSRDRARLLPHHRHVVQAP